MGDNRYNSADSRISVREGASACCDGQSGRAAHDAVSARGIRHAHPSVLDLAFGFFVLPVSFTAVLEHWFLLPFVAGHTNQLNFARA